jgi:protein transport protein SEC31
LDFYPSSYYYSLCVFANVIIVFCLISPVHQKPVIATLTRLFNETSEALGGSRANPAKKREIEDNSRKLGALFAKLNSEDISKNAADKLVQLCQALDNGDFSTALQIQVQFLENSKA